MKKVNTGKLNDIPDSELRKFVAYSSEEENASDDGATDNSEEKNEPNDGPEIVRDQKRKHHIEI